MKLQFMFLGKKHPNNLHTMITKYVDRLSKYVKIEFHFLNEKSTAKLEQRIFTKNQSKILKISGETHLVLSFGLRNQQKF